MRKRIWLLSWFVVLCLLITGCNNQKSSQDADSKGSIEKNNSKKEDNELDVEKKQVRFSWWGSEVRHKATIEAIELFEKEHPNIDIVPEYAGYEGYQDKLMAQIAGGNPPDIFTDVSEWFPTLYEANALDDMTNAFDMSGHSKAMIEACSYNGMVCGVNVSLNGYVIYYNQTLAEKYGVKVPDGDYTWDDLMAMCKDIYDKSNGEVYGMVDPRSASTAISCYCYTVLGKQEPFPWTNDKLTITADDFVEYQRYLESQPEGVLLPPDQSFSVDDFSASAVAQGEALCTYQSMGLYDSIQSQTDDKISILLIPRGKNGENANTGRPGLIESIYSGSKVKKEAAEFLDWFTNSEEAAKILKCCRGVLPTEVQRKAVLSEPGLLSENDNLMIETIDKIFQGDLKTFLPGPVGASEVMEVTQISVGEEVAFGNLKVEDSGKKFMEEAQLVLKR